MHDFGWKCSPVERAGTEVHDYRGGKTPDQALNLTGTVAPAPAPPKPVARKVAPKPAPKPIAKAAPLAAVSTGKPSRPDGLASARGGKADNLQQISGVGPKLEKTLHGLGFYHFDQIAVWNKDQVDWVDEHLRFKGRIDRDEWIPQSRLLADGNMDQFAKLYGTGGLRGKSGASRSGSRTRKS